MTTRSPKVARAIGAAIASAEHCLGHLRDLQTTFKDPLKAPSSPAEPAADPAARHRAAHLRGRPGKIDADPELRAFVQARIATHTFAAIEAEVAATFPPHRRTSLSAIHRWWQRHRPDQ